ncbi:unnamed protein product [Closterium sp. Yama58-4]|nr:unnamed protein product [Closterium sp. Yama58-4]
MRCRGVRCCGKDFEFLPCIPRFSVPFPCSQRSLSSLTPPSPFSPLFPFRPAPTVPLRSPSSPRAPPCGQCGVLAGLIRRLRDTHPHLVPQVIMVDGNGIFHPQGFGLACQLGVQADIPTIGVAKNMYYMDGMTDEQVGGLKRQHLHQPGDWALLTGASGATHAALVRGGPGSHDPVFVSVGHRISLESAVAITQHCCKHRVPEPVRLADGLSRAELRGVTVAEAVGGEGSGASAEQRGIGES